MNSSDLLPIRVLHDFSGRMDLLDISYMLTGSMAMFQYSAYRMTADIDIVLELTTPAGPAFIEELEPEYYIPHGSMMRAIGSEGIFNVIHQETAFKVDCVLRKSTPYQETAFERRATVDFHGKDITIITAEDLIISKLLWARDTGSEKQLNEVTNLLRNPLDVNYIESWAERMEIMEAYENCRRGNCAMNDTSLEIEIKQFEMMMKLGAEKRITLGCEMYLAARDRFWPRSPRPCQMRNDAYCLLKKCMAANFQEVYTMTLSVYKHAIAAWIAIVFIVSAASAQKAEMSISLNEPFFDGLLDAIYQNFDPPEFSLAQNLDDPNENSGQSSGNGPFSSFLDSSMTYSFGSRDQNVCGESVKILKEMSGVRTAVRFREGKINVPLAFNGTYAAPFIGCVEFAGWAEANLDLEFDQNAQRLVGRVRVLNVNLNGTGGVGGSLIAKMIQGSIDKKLNPIDILSLEKLSIGVPIQNRGNIRVKAVGARPEVVNGALNIVVSYQFLKS